MKKKIIVLLAMFASVLTVSAQSMKVYQNGQLKAIYYVSPDDKLVFSDDFPFPDEKDEEITHEAVDLGLSVKWATMNVGATTPEGYGDYFAWGETEAKSTYDFDSYKWCYVFSSSKTYTKYCTSSSSGFVDNLTTLEPADDAAYVNWGGSWRMPTDAEQAELRENCTWTWTAQNGVIGYKVTSKKNGNSIFLPAAGLYSKNSVGSVGSSGYYWSSSLKSSTAAYHLSFYSSSVSVQDRTREIGHSIRAVCP